MRTSPLLYALAALGAVLTLHAPGCDPNAADDTPSACALDCGAHGRCDDDLPPGCRCDPGYTGLTCDLCDDGYELRGERCEPVPISCASAPDPCAPGGACASDPAGDRCECLPGYTGRLCGECSATATALPDGRCQPSCEDVGLTCAPPAVCRTDGFAPMCGCPRGTTGPGCEQCVSGWTPRNGRCLPSCNAFEWRCAELGEGCIDSASGGAARCLCPAGREGDECERCSPGLVADSEGRCSADALPNDALLALSGVPTARVWALRPQTATPLAPLLGLYEDRTPVSTHGAGGLAAATGRQALILHRNSVFISYDERTGVMTGERLTIGDGLPGPLAWDEARGRAFAVGADHTLVEVDLDAQTALAVTDPLPVRALLAVVMEPTSGRPWVLGQRQWETLEWFEIEVEARTFASRGTLPLPAESMFIAAAWPPGRSGPVALVRTPSNPEAALTELCTGAPEFVGDDVRGYRHVGGWAERVEPGSELLLEDDGPTPPLLMHGAGERRPDATWTLRVRTPHPDAVVCVVTDGGHAEVTLEPGTHPRRVILISRGDITFDVRNLQPPVAYPLAATHVIGALNITPGGQPEALTRPIGGFIERYVNALGATVPSFAWEQALLELDPATGQTTWIPLGRLPLLQTLTVRRAAR